MCSFPWSLHFPWSPQPPFHCHFCLHRNRGWSACSPFPCLWSLLYLRPTLCQVLSQPQPETVSKRRYFILIMFKAAYCFDIYIGQNTKTLLRWVKQYGGFFGPLRCQGRDYSAFLIAFISQVTEFYTAKTEASWLEGGRKIILEKLLFPNQRYICSSYCTFPFFVLLGTWMWYVELGSHLQPWGKGQEL